MELTMDDNTKAVVQHMDEELDGLDTLKFSYTDKNINFNISDNGDTQVVARLTCDVTSRECTFDTPDDEVSEEIVVTCKKGVNDYIVVTDNYLDIPILESFGINYIVSPNMDLQQKHIDAINETSVCLTTIADLSTKYKTIQSIIVPLNFSKLSSQIKATTSLFDVAIAIQNEEKDGLEAINKYLYSCYKDYIKSDSNNNNASGDAGVIVENKVLPATQKVTNNFISHEAQPTLTVISIGELVADLKYQQRVHEDKSAIEDLTRAYKEGEEIPPIEVVDTGNEKIIIDGFHRYSGAIKAGFNSIKCYVINGSEQQAFVLSLGANAENMALKRTNNDKRKAVTKALTCKDFNSKSHREIAAICKVSPGLVDKIAKELKAKDTSSSTPAYIGTNNKTKEISNKSTNADDSAYIGSDVTDAIQPNVKASKNMSQKISNDYVSLSIIVKKTPDEMALNNLMADLNEAINSYESELKEAK